TASASHASRIEASAPVPSSSTKRDAPFCVAGGASTSRAPMGPDSVRQAPRAMVEFVPTEPEICPRTGSAEEGVGTGEGVARPGAQRLAVPADEPLGIPAEDAVDRAAGGRPVAKARAEQRRRPDPAPTAAPQLHAPRRVPGDVPARVAGDQRAREPVLEE